MTVSKRILVLVGVLVVLLGALLLVPKTGEAHWLGVDECRAALAGANGDDDIVQFIRAEGNVGKFVRWAPERAGHPYYPGTHAGQHRVLYGTDFSWVITGGYCFYQDGAIVDKVGRAPAGFIL